MTYGRLEPKVKFCDCWRSSGVEQLPCKQWVGGSNPPASASVDDRFATRNLSSRAGRFGEVPKWPKGADCKSAGVRLRGFKSSPPHHCSDGGATDSGVGGLNEMGVAPGVAPMGGLDEVRVAPTRATTVRPANDGGVSDVCGNSSAVERQPSKLGVAGSNPVSRSRREARGGVREAHVAQLVEHALGKGEVSGSIPDMGSRIRRTCGCGVNGR